MSSLSLSAEGLNLWRGERHVLRSVSFELAGGQILQVTGSNGAGKTTLLRTLCGLIYPEEGRVCWGGIDVQRDLRAFQATLSYLGHEPPLAAELTAQENLRYWVGLRQRLVRGSADAALERVGAGSFRDQPVRTLSAGQRRRVALAALTLMSVPLWLLDEPTTNLDADGQQLVGTLIAEQTGRGGLVVAAVHHELPVPPAGLRRLELPPL